MGPEKLLILALIVALIFGAGAVPRMARRAGRGIRETRDALGIDELREEIGGVRSTLSADSAAEPPRASTSAGPIDSGPASPGPAPDSPA